MMVNGGLRMFYGKCIREPMKMITCLICAAWISLPLLLISLIMVPGGAWLVRSVSRRMKSSTESEMKGMSDVFQSLIETFSAVKTVRIFNRERTERRRFKGCSELLYHMSLRISFYDSLLRPITEVLGIISISIALLAGAYLVLNQQTHLFGDWLKITNTPLKPEQLILFYALLAGASDLRRSPQPTDANAVALAVDRIRASHFRVQTARSGPSKGRSQDPLPANACHRWRQWLREVNVDASIGSVLRS